MFARSSLNWLVSLPFFAGCTLRARRIFVLAGAAVLADSASAQSSDSAEAPPLAIVGVSAIDPRSARISPDTTVVIADGRVTNVEDDSVSPPPDAEIIDGEGKFLIPGLWDMHVHLPYARRSALPALVANGVTGVRDMGSDLSEIDRWRTLIDSDVFVGPTIVRAGPMLNGMEFNEYQLAVADGAEARTAVRTLNKIGVDFIKMHRRTSTAAFHAIADEARRLGLSFSGHIPMTVTPSDASAAGVATIEHTETLFEGTFASQRSDPNLAQAINRWRMTKATSLFSTFVRNDTMVVPTLIAQGHLLDLLDSSEPDPRGSYIARSARLRAGEMLAEIRPQTQAFLSLREPVFRELQATVALMNESGVELLAGSDLSFLHAPGFSLHDELALLVASGVEPAQALQAATSNPAKLFGAPEAGHVAVGAPADLVLLDANPLQDIENTRRIHGVLLRGRYFPRNELTGLLNEAQRLAESH